TTHALTINLMYRFTYLTFQQLPSTSLFPYTTLFRSRWSNSASTTSCRTCATRSSPTTVTPPPYSSGPCSRCRSAMRCSPRTAHRSEEHTSELQSRENLVCRLLLEKKKKNNTKKKGIK